ncbi:MAG: hypothetical protein K6G23_11160, partial [Lachnospiraceae bacterium]|nr:hypothetical protein [Lachnospiraceae bacterium]
MKKLSQKVIDYIYILFLGFIVGFGIYSYATAHPNMGFGAGSYEAWNENWYVKVRDGKYTSVTLPLETENEKAESTTIRKQLPEEMNPDDVLFIKSIHQNIVATVDGEEIYRYQYETTQYINEGFAPTQWISIPVSNAY